MSDERGTTTVKPLEVGDRMNWLRSSRGGYGFITPIAAVVLKIGPKRIQVRIAQRIAGAWQTKACLVEADSLNPINDWFASMYQSTGQV